MICLYSKLLKNYAHLIIQNKFFLAWLNLSFLHNSQWITFTIHSGIVHFFYVSLLLSLMWLTHLSLSPHNSSFFAYFVVFESSYLCIDAVFNASELSSSFSFLTLAVSQCHLQVVRPYASSVVFVFSGQFVKVYPLSNSKLFPSILFGKKPRCLSICRDFCYIIWSRVFSFSPLIQFTYFFHLRFLMVCTWNVSKYL